MYFLQRHDGPRWPLRTVHIACTVVVLWGLHTSIAWCQSTAPLVLDPTLHISQYIHQAWQVEDGLPQNSVYDITQTNDGYLWFGTQEGLVRFDGVRFTVFDKTRVEGLENNQISALVVTQAGTLWIGTSGSGVIRLHDGQFTRYDTDDGLSSNHVWTLHESQDGTLWIGTLGGGLNRFNGTSFTHYTTEDGLAGDDVLSIEEDSDGSLWVGTHAGVSHLADETLTSYTPEDGLPGALIRALEVDTQGQLWIGTDQGLTHYRDGRFHTYTVEDGLCGNAITALYTDAAGSLWIGTYFSGLCRFENDRFGHFSKEHGLTHNLVRTLFSDQEGNLWIGTDGGGLNQLRMGKFIPITTTEGLSNNVVWSVLEDHQGAMWIGTEGGGLNRFYQGTTTHYTTADGLSSNNAVALYEDTNHTLWVGTYGGGLCRHADDGSFECYTTNEGLSSNNVYAIQEDAQGALWIGTDQGLDRFDQNQFTSYTAEDGLSSTFITAIRPNTTGGLWVGTYGGGLNRLRGDQITPYNTRDGFPSDRVLTLYRDTQHTLWIGTEGSGLCRFREESFVCLNRTDGLHDDNVLQLIEDDRGYLWLGSQKGISRIPLQELNAYADGEQETITPIVYDRSDGLQTTELNGGTQPPVWKSRDGRLWFSTLRGVAVIDPTNISVNTHPPPVHVEQLVVNGEPVDLASPVVLPPHSKDFEFHYAGLSFAAPEKVRFLYKLEGQDRTWKEAGNRRSATYTNLPPGEYQFRVAARNNDGIWNERGAALTFRVQPFFYQTYWFYLLCFIGLSALVAGAYRLRIQQLRAREQTLQILVDDQTAELRERERELAQLNKDLEEEVQRQLDEKLAERVHYERELIAAKEKAEASARLKSSILTNMSHEIRTPISSILGYAQILGEELDHHHQEFVDYIQQNGKRLLDTLNSILDLSRLESERAELEITSTDLRESVRETVSLLRPAAAKKNLTLRSTLPPNPVDALVDPDALARILHNLVGNAIKFTDAGEVVVETGRNEERAYLKVRDTGVGIGQEFLPHLFEEFKQESTGTARSYEGSGLGLAITKRLVEAMQGTISVDSTKGEGTTFTVHVPLAAVESNAQAEVSNA